jgi:hypothetical protein
LRDEIDPTLAEEVTEFFSTATDVGHPTSFEVEDDTNHLLRRRKL